MKLLVTGSSGLVGSACVEFFTNKGWDVIGIDNNMRSRLFNTPTKEGFVKVDIRDEGAVNKLFSQHSFDAIMHAAGQPSHDWSTKEPLVDFEINARGTLILLEATRNYCPDATFVFVSTDKVYGENMKRRTLKEYQGESGDEWRSPYTPVAVLEETETRYSSTLPFTEDLGLDFAGHRSLFGCSKAAADMYTQEYAHTYGLTTGVFRPGCITGKNHEGAELHGFLAYLAKCIKTGTPYKVFGFMGKQVRDQIHAHDLANAFYHFIQHPRKGEVYNIGGGMERSVSVLEAISLLEREIGKRCIYEFHDARPGDRQWDVHDVSKFRKDYPNWNYQYSLADIIKDLA